MIRFNIDYRCAILRRLTESVNELQNTNRKIADIACDFQYGSPESFTRAFRKQFNINPSEIRNGYSLTSLPLVYPITNEYINQSDKIKNVPPELVELEEKILVGISFFIGDESEVNDLSPEWSRFMNETFSIKEKIFPERYYQVQYWSENQEIGGFYFFIGMEVSKIMDLNPLYVVKVIPKGKYLKFVHKGLANRVGYTYKYIYTQFLPETEYKLSKPFNYEFYGPKCLGPYNEKSESEIFIPVE